MDLAADNARNYQDVNMETVVKASSVGAMRDGLVCSVQHLPVLRSVRWRVGVIARNLVCVPAIKGTGGTIVWTVTRLQDADMEAVHYLESVSVNQAGEDHCVIRLSAHIVYMVTVSLQVSASVI